MKFPLFLVIAICISAGVQAADPKYPVSKIPENLKTGANVVKRIENIEFTIVNTGSTIYKYHYALTILNRFGDKHAGFKTFYDKLSKIVSIDANLYDANGNLIKKLKTKDITDLSAVSDNNLMDDSRVKLHNFNYNSYPYTVEYIVEERFNNTFHFPGWAPQPDENYSVEESSYTIICPENYTVRYREFNYPGEAVKKAENGKSKIRWQVGLLAPFKEMFANSSLRDLTTVIYFAPTSFEIEGYKGNMQSWNDFAKFQSSLNVGRDVLPTNISDKVREICAGVSSDEEKVKLLYEYFQKNTRYISIQLGLGGWQPFDAGYVAKKGYGDCKALTNYMQSLLKEAGIRSLYSIVNAGAKTTIMEDFPSLQFNHVILCVPLEKDSIWLECTSQSLPAGYMSAFTGNTKALMSTESGGQLIATPRYGLNENKELRYINARLKEEGELEMQIRTSYSCLKQDQIWMKTEYLPKDQIRKELEKQYDLGTYHIIDFKYTKQPGRLPVMKEEIELVANSYAVMSGKRLFINPNILNRSNKNPAETEGRKADFIFNTAFHDEDSVEIEIPSGYTVESLPKDIALKSAYGNYSVSYRFEGNRISYKRMFEQFDGRFKAPEQKEIVAFFNAVFKQDRASVVLIKQ